MKKLILLVAVAIMTFSCNYKQDLSVYNTNLEIAKKYLSSYEAPTDFEFFKSITDENIEHQSPMYGAGKVGYEEVLDQGKFYMENFENVVFKAEAWLPGVDEETLEIDGSVRVYGNWSGNNIASGKKFSVDAYHYLMVENGKITASGDYFDATGMVMAVQPEPVAESVESDSIN
ncbi:MAG: hypothetical protein ISQ95_05100 [Flavobacteriales bacterium]|nr:hypothetical protein [Flavobacteriales bacterium]